MTVINTDHFVTEEFDTAIRGEADIFGSDCTMHFSFCVNEMDCCKHTRTQNRPHLFFSEWALFFKPCCHLIFQRVVDVLEYKNNLVKGGTEGVLRLCGEMLKVEDMFVLICKAK